MKAFQSDSRANETSLYDIDNSLMLCVMRAAQSGS